MKGITLISEDLHLSSYCTWKSFYYIFINSNTIILLAAHLYGDDVTSWWLYMKFYLVNVRGFRERCVRRGKFEGNPYDNPWHLLTAATAGRCRLDLAINSHEKLVHAGIRVNIKRRAHRRKCYFAGKESAREQRSHGVKNWRHVCEWTNVIVARTHAE